MRDILFLVMLVVCLGAAVFTLADDRCPLTGNTYSFEVDDTRYELSGFDCTFGPGCEADCDLWYGDFDTGPLYHAILPFQCDLDGSVIINGIPCGLTSGGNLECLLVDTLEYKCYRVGNKTWCVSGDKVLLNFEQE
jgi:hypothetical protein